MTLYYLSDEGRLRKTADAFGLSRTCVSVTIRRVAYAITNHMGPRYMNLPPTVGARTAQNGRQQVGAEFIGDFRLIRMLLLLVGQIICNWYAWLVYKAARRSQ